MTAHKTNLGRDVYIAPAAVGWADGANSFSGSRLRVASVSCHLGLGK
jgi:hypothetical protein